jgi:tetratricopeptide (TPR) repeat protein
VHDEAIWGEIEDLGERFKDPNIAAEIAGHRLQMAFFEGRLEDAAEEVRTLLAEGSKTEGFVAQARTIAIVRGLRPLLYLGRNQEAVELVGGDSARRVPLGMSPAQEQFFMLALAHAGRIDEASLLLDKWIGVPDNGRFSETSGQFLSLALETAVLTRSVDFVPAIVEALRPSAGQITYAELSCAGRLLGAEAQLLGHADEARVFYANAIDVATRTLFRPEIALTRLHLAELLLEHYRDEHDEAIEHLDFAIAEFRDMKMQPSLERALGHRGLLKA